jgi:hypothetical protein
MWDQGALGRDGGISRDLLQKVSGQLIVRCDLRPDEAVCIRHHAVDIVLDAAVEDPDEQIAHHQRQDTELHQSAE